MIDSSLPAVVFVIVNAIGGLREAVTAAIAVGVVIFILRIVRREPVTQAFYGFIAVAVAAYLAARTGKAQAFFLPGIALNAIYGTVGLLSLIVGRPLAGYVIAALDTRYEHWREDRPLRRAAFLATLTWTAVFALRVVVQGLLYLAGSTGWLAVAKIGMGWPLWGIALAITLWLLRRVRQIESDQTPGPDSEPSGSAVPPSNAAS
jgi:intracellular septation protein A